MATPDYDHFKRKHDSLIQEEYAFLGWAAVGNECFVDFTNHNTIQSLKKPIDNRGIGGKYVNGKKWSGLWLSSNVERCYGYVKQHAPKELPWICRVYLKKSSIEELEVCIERRKKLRRDQIN